MAMVENYSAFDGRHPETGSVQNMLKHMGVVAPHMGAPITEALLMGISGGAAVGYFTFEYEGYAPHVALLTRNTFDPLNTLLERMAIPRDEIQTTSAKKGDSNLLAVLEGGQVAIVRADSFSLPHNDLPWDDSNWRMMPLVVYGLEGDMAYLADRSSAPVIVPAEALHNARARVKKDRFVVMTLDAPDFERLPGAVSEGIWQCISLYTDAPPQGKKDNFGLAALQHLAKLLTNTRNKASWERFFPRGGRLWMALAGNIPQQGLYGWIHQGEGNAGERGMYADFLMEAADILAKPALTEAADLFRKSETQWAAMLDLLLPDDVPLMKETAGLIQRRRRIYIEQGSAALDEIKQINTRLNEIEAAAGADFPLDEAGVVALREAVAAQLLAIHDTEQEAVVCLQSVMA